MIDKYFTQSFTVSRMVWSNDSSGEVETGTFKGTIQQANPEVVAHLNLSLTLTFFVWCPIDTDVMEGDSLTSGNDTYNVKGVQRNNYGDNPHTKLIVEKDVMDVSN